MAQPYPHPWPPDRPPPPPPAAPRRRNWLVIALAATSALVLVGLAVAVPHGVDVWRRVTAPTLDEVKVFEDVRSDHTDNPVDYDPAPPPGGPHDAQWLACGVYDEPVRDENAVHSLEHGAVWLTYDPDEVTDDDVALLEERLPDEGILSPYPGQAAPVIVTVWERQLELRDAADDRLALFLAEYADGHTSPEPMASCAGGVRTLEEDGDESVNV